MRSRTSFIYIALRFALITMSGYQAWSGELAQEASGTLLVHRYEGGALSSTWEGSFSIGANDSKYAIRMALPAALSMRYIHVVSDLRSTYQAQKIAIYEKPKGTALSRSHAKFESGDMPNGIEFGGAVQALALAHLLLKERAANRLPQHIEDSRVPDVFRKRVFEVGRTELVHKISAPEAMSMAFQFWGAHKGTAGEIDSSSRICLV